MSIVEQKIEKAKFPLLRFLEFTDSWTAISIEEIINRVSKPVDVEESNLYQQIGIRSHGKGIFYKEPVTGKTLGNKRVFWIQPNMFIVNIVFAWEHAVARTTEKELGMIASHRFPMYEPIKDKVNLDFLMYFFLRKKGKHLLELASPGGAGRNKTLGQQTFAKLKVNLPKLPEQQKIANFLSSVDKKIEQLRQKVSLLEDYKKGVMQQIFSQQIRFKDDNGEAFADWEVKRLGEITSITTGSSNREDSLLDGEYTFFDRSQDIRTSNRFLFEGEAVIVAGEGQDFIPKYFIGKFDLHQRTYAIMNFKDVLSKYIFYYIHFHRYYFFRYAVGSTVKSLRLPIFKKMIIKCPCLKEQQKIANYLSSLDDKIQQTQTQLKQTQAFKKGLLQQLFV